jgi:hypothetical protein
MQKTLALFLLLALCCVAGRGLVLYAQDAPYDETIPDDDDNGSQSDSDYGRYIPDMYTKGDQSITVSLGTIFPTVFLNNGTVINHNFSPPVGGVLSLAYTYFLGPNIFLGGEVGFASAFTLGKNAFYMIPFGLRAGWQFVFSRFEFPVYGVIGMAPQKYLDYGYFGMYLKGAVSAYYRYNPNWSFGISADWSWYPQWPMKDGKRIPEKDIDANIVGVLLSARYHF